MLAYRGKEGGNIRLMNKLNHTNLAEERLFANVDDGALDLAKLVFVEDDKLELGLFGVGLRQCVERDVEFWRWKEVRGVQVWGVGDGGGEERDERGQGSRIAIKNNAPWLKTGLRSDFLVGVRPTTASLR